MDKNIRLDPDLLRICEKHLSPFGQKVLSTLIKLKNENQNKTNNLSQPKHCNYQNQRVIKFNGSESPITPTIINDIYNGNCLNNHNNDLPTISTTVDLLKTTDFNDANINNKTNEGNNTIEIDDPFALTFQKSGMNVETNKIHDEKETSTVIPWNDIFDSQLLNDIIDSNVEINDMQNKSSDSQPFTISSVKQKRDPIADLDDKKRKKSSKMAEPLKKIKISGVKTLKPKNVYRKEKYTTSVNNWLDNVDANNEVEGNTLAQIHVNEIHDEAKISNEMEPKKDDNVSKTASKPKYNKKIIQAQLANKDGIMKFKKPNKIVEVNKTLESSEVTNNNKSIENTIKTKTPKNPVPTKTNQEKKVPKFVAPIKSQLPVKDLTFSITVINDNNFKEYKNKLELITDSEVVIVLMYRNGFSQLNSQHTDDSCVPEGILLHFNDTYYYLEGRIDGCAEVLRNICLSNTLVCYEAKDFIIHLRCLFELSFTVCNIIDVKIGSNLINPDKPPENFSDVQKLLESTPDYTIATECPLQKAAWYITLLKESSNKLRSMLIESGLWKVFIDIEMKILPIVAEMQHRGVSVDIDKLKIMENILMNRMNEIEAECYKAAGKTFQINSSVQVRTILYDELKLDTKSNVKIKETICKGAKSTAEAMFKLRGFQLRCLTSVHPLPKLVLEYRHLHKAHATFLTGIAQHVRDGVIKPTWDQTAAATGRIASNNPNLQAIPKAPFNLVLFPNEDDGASGSKDQTLEFRSVYVPRKGYTLLAADFKHVECRVFAQYAQDTRLHDALRQNDIFRVLAAEWLKKPEADVTSEDRERTKRIVYASLYGAGTRKLMEILNLGYDQVLSIMSSFHRTFPSLKSFGRSVVSECEKRNGRLTIASGRARTFHNICSFNFSDKSHAERQAVNFIIQGTAADLCKTAMILTSERLRQSDPPVAAHLLLQIHDELVWEVLGQDVDRAADIIKHSMENCGLECGVDLTLAVAMYRGTSWGEMEEFTPN